MSANLGPVTADDSGQGGFQLRISAGGAGFVADQPVASGGLGLGPSPHDLVAAGLAACTAQTLRLYAGRKGWPLGPVHVAVTFGHDAALTPSEEFHVAITLGGDLDEEQRERFMEIAERCPVHRLLEPGARIFTTQA